MKADLAARETASRELLIFPRPAGKRDNIAPAGRAGLGGMGPVHDRLRNVAQQQPAILSFSATLSKSGIVHHLGMFDTPEAAHDAYVCAARQFHGEFAIESSITKVVGSG